MRTRLVLIILVLTGVPLLAGTVPAASVVAGSVQQRMFLDRLQDATRLAGTAQQAVTGVELKDLDARLARYSEIYGIAAGIADRSGTLRMRHGEPALLDDPVVRRQATAALAGRTSRDPGVIWPWERAWLVVAVPVMRGGDMVGAVVTVSRTDTLRASVLRRLVVFGSAMLLALMAAGLLASRLASWALKPVYQLDAATSEIARGKLGFKVEGVTGPAELRRLAGSFNTMVARVGKVLRAQSQFVADASHQLKTPLTVLTLRLESLEASVGAAGREELSEVADEVQRLNQILESLIRLANTGHGGVNTRKVDMVDLVGRRVNAWQTQAAACGLDLRAELDVVPSWGARAGTDPTLFSSALDAVIDNAIKFSPSQGTVTVSVLPGAGTIDVVVCDSGPGLSPEELSRVGDRFWRSTKHQNVKGSGLGLAVVRAVMEALDGSVSFEAAAPTGLCVVLRVPRDAADGGVTRVVPFPRPGGAERPPPVDDSRPVPRIS